MTQRVKEAILWNGPGKELTGKRKAIYYSVLALLLVLYLAATILTPRISHSQTVIHLGEMQLPVPTFAGVLTSLANICIILIVMYYGKPGFLFALPYLVCSSYAGWVSDRFRKSRVFVWSKWLELLVMFIGVLLFRGGAVWPLLGVLFLMGAQSALYSPAKYGYLPETLDASELSNGNGLTQMFTFLAIIAGTWAGGLVADVHSGKWWIGGMYCVTVAVAGIATSYFIAKTPDGNCNAVFRLNPDIKDFYAFTKDDVSLEGYQFGPQIENIPIAI